MSDCAIPNCGKAAPVDDAFCAEHGGRRGRRRKAPEKTLKTAEDWALAAMDHLSLHHDVNPIALAKWFRAAIFNAKGKEDPFPRDIPAEGLFDAILIAMRRYKVHNHYKGTASGRRAVYAVFGPSGQASETMGHAEAVAMRDQLIARDIMAMIE